MLAMVTTLPTATSASGSTRRQPSEISEQNGDRKLKTTALNSGGGETTASANATTSNPSKPANSLVQYHQPFVSSPAPFSSNSQVTLPPISSFDNLIRAAEKQYSNSKVANNSAVTSPVNGTSPGFLSYQLSSTENSCNTTVPRTVIHRPSSATSTSSSGSPSFSPRSSIAMASPGLENSFSPLLSGHQTSEHQHHIVSKHEGGDQPYLNKVHKPRKKKQCPICHNFYANLSTHKSTHLTPEDRPHKCPICQRGFARNNDLIRHKKRHWKDEIIENSSVENSDADDHVNTHTHLDEHDQLRSLHQIKGTFKCPFNSALIQLDMEIYPYKSKPLNFETSNCHQTGVFSRCDTFKNHLKALHFEYPPGTKKRDRTVVPGRCKHCGLKFPNVDIWLNEHVGKTCGYTYH